MKSKHFVAVRRFIGGKAESAHHDWFDFETVASREKLVQQTVEFHDMKYPIMADYHPFQRIVEIKVEEISEKTAELVNNIEASFRENLNKDSILGLVNSMAVEQEAFILQALETYDITQLFTDTFDIAELFEDLFPDDYAEAFKEFKLNFLLCQTCSDYFIPTTEREKQIADREEPWYCKKCMGEKSNEIKSS